MLATTMAIARIELRILFFMEKTSLYNLPLCGYSFVHCYFIIRKKI